MGGWVGPRAGLDDVEKRNVLSLPGLELRRIRRPARTEFNSLVPTWTRTPTHPSSSPY
jgi:hypothetical protein